MVQFYPSKDVDDYPDIYITDDGKLIVNGEVQEQTDSTNDSVETKSNSFCGSFYNTTTGYILSRDYLSQQTESPENSFDSTEAIQEGREIRVTEDGEIKPHGKSE